MLTLATDGGPGAGATALALAFLTLLLVPLYPTAVAAHPDEEPVSADIKGPAATAPPATVVKMNDDMPMYSPPQVTIKAGQTVEWRNTGTVSHSATNNPKLADNPEDALFPSGSEVFNSGSVMPGGTFRHTFKIPGRYRYYCLSHEKDKMIGEIMVEAVPVTKTSKAPPSHRKNRETPPSDQWLNTYPPEPAR